MAAWEVEEAGHPVLPNLKEVEIHEEEVEILTFHFQVGPRMEGEGEEVHLERSSSMACQILEEVEVQVVEDQNHFREVALGALVVLEAYFHEEEAFQDDANLAVEGALVAFLVDRAVVAEVSHGAFHRLHLGLTMIAVWVVHQQIIDEAYQLVTKDFVQREDVQPRFRAARLSNLF